MKPVKKIFIITLCILLLSPAMAASAASYTVKSNDTLYSLGKLFNTSVKSLQYSNNFDENSLSPGDKIYVPAHVYKVKSGDSLHKIATKYEIPLSNLKKANGKKADSIKPGQKLMIPGVKPNKKSDTVISYSGNDVDLLAKLIEAEAAGESMKAKIAVGAVVINRIQSKDWAPTISKVINQKFGEYYQFTPVKIGTIHNTPSSASKKAAWIAMYGSDPSNGAIFYFDQSSKNKWLWSKPIKAQIDHMVYVK
ncbi:MAG: peptidoglycan-binding protein [Herbinix sp.]|jgi:spore germination cell wall hydrolase CwlJ-like protein|nr:peptidoglycan-binding protein [Herbinix sp.]